MRADLVYVLALAGLVAAIGLAFLGASHAAPLALALASLVVLLTRREP